MDPETVTDEKKNKKGESEMNYPDFNSVIGKGLGPRYMDYTWRDVALYALAVGAKKEDLTYIFERPGMKALPTFGLLPYLNSILLHPQRRVPYAPGELVGDLVINALGGKIPNRLHMGVDLIMHQPIYPYSGRFLTEDEVEKVFDWGDKGIVSQTKMDVYDVAGQPVCTMRNQHYIAAFGHFGGEPYSSGKLTYPDREPDAVVEDHIADNLAAIYRLLGDTYTTHIDPKVGQGYGYKGPFMQGLCSVGFGCRMAIQAFIPNEPERVTHYAAQMRSVTFPDTDVKLLGWKIGEGVVYFKLLGENGKPILDNAVMEYK